MNLPKTLLILLLLFLSGCSSAKVVMLDKLPQGAPRSVALLPTDYPASIQRERVDYLRNSLISELRSNGFIILDDAVVNKVCSTPECPESAKLSEKKLVDGFLYLKLESVTRNSFLAGYYNAIRGKLTLSDRSRKELLTVDNTESERGGLLFNSGQIFQGVISQIKNGDKDSFSNLADRFGQTLVSKIPKPTVTVFQDEGASVAIQSVNFVTKRGAANEICVRATPESMAYLLLPGIRSNLREASPGSYCGLFRMEDLPSSMASLTVEVRSPFGSSARSTLKAANDNACNLMGRVRFEENGSQRRIVLTCTRLGSSGKANFGECKEEPQNCADHKLLVYQASSETGPYSKLTELRNISWPLPKSDSKKPALYRVVAVNRFGDFSVPELPKE